MEFLGYRFGWNYRRTGDSAYIGNRPSQASVQSICRKISERKVRSDDRAASLPGGLEAFAVPSTATAPPATSPLVSRLPSSIEQPSAR